jgi:hypothetical protein
MMDMAIFAYYYIYYIYYSSLFIIHSTVVLVVVLCWDMKIMSWDDDRLVLVLLVLQNQLEEARQKESAVHGRTMP